MGNLLGSPITEKDTHVGTTHDSNANDSESADGGGMEFGISSMQGWRIHMEDAHIAQPFLYAEKLNEKVDISIASNAAGITPCKKTAIEATLSELEGDNNTMATEVNVTEKTPAKAKSPDTGSTSNNGKYIQIPLPNHSLFAVFDGHGGSFAAEYASRNLLRVLCRSTTFCEYAEKWRGREDYFAGLKAASGENGDDDKAADKETPGKLDDKQQLQKRGRDSDEKAKQIKEQVRKHLDGGKAVTSSNNSDAEFARATYDHELMTLLEHSLRDAFLNLDAEILREVRGEKCEDANMPYGAGYDLSQHSLQGCVGHLPKEAGDDDATKAAESSSSSSSSSILPPFNKEMNDPISHPVPSDDEDAGTTAVAVMVTPKWIVCTNAGDSRAVYSRSNHRAVPLSYDHKPEDEDEERRIREAGGYVSGGRVEGDLAVSRGLGDYRFKDLDAVLSGAEGERTPHSGTSILQRTIIASTLKEQGGGEEEDMPMLRPSEQKVSPVPDIIVQNRDPKEDEFIVIACDGIWDVLTNQECVRMVADIFGEGEGDLGLVCEEVLDLCLIKGSKDNMTAAVIKLPKQVIGEGGGVSARRERRGGSSSSAANNTGESGGNRGEQQPLQGRVYNPYVPPAMRDGQQEEDKGGDDDQWEGTRG